MADPLTSWQLMLAYSADLAFADPAWMPHPVKVFGRLAQWGETSARSTARSPRTLKLAGVLLAFTIPMLAGAGSWLLLGIVGKFSRATEYVAAIYFAYTALSVRGLDQAGKKVIDRLQRGEVAEARICLGMIVGRDTQDLDEPEIVRAVIETLAENSCDGVLAPLFYLALGGVTAGLAYKAINTLDSMIGYKNDRYLHFGWAAARLDDVVNFVPARLAAVLAAASAFILRLSWKESLRIVSRDARLQPSPNSGFTEAAFAGALGIRLGGINRYDGCEFRKAYLGDPKRDLTSALYPEVRRLLYLTSALALILSMGISGLLSYVHL
ncbi:MAG TPA: adenosylcobinamide-phosphate synthase CbiB [Terriglobia bacterium]|nr:adenosylcobinamide-phosphate synthase CbiB [Terriglobia bacterium]